MIYDFKLNSSVSFAATSSINRGGADDSMVSNSTLPLSIEGVPRRGEGVVLLK